MGGGCWVEVTEVGKRQLATSLRAGELDLVPSSVRGDSRGIRLPLGRVGPGWHDEMFGDNRGLNPVSMFRLSQRLHGNGHPRTARLVQGFSFVVFRTILPPAVTAGFGLELNHRGFNVVIHPLTTLGERVRIQHGVTIANTTRLSDPIRRRTLIGDRVKIGACAVIIGPLTIGEGAEIGAGAVVTHDVPAGETWAGNPARRLHDEVRPNLVPPRGSAPS